MTDKHVRVAYIVLNEITDDLLKNVHALLAQFPGDYSMHVSEPDEDDDKEEKFFPLYIQNPSRDGNGDLIGRGRVTDVSDIVNVELEIYDAEVIRKLHDFDILDMSMGNINLMRKEGSDENR